MSDEPLNNLYLLRQLYECQLRSSERNFAHGHGFPEFVDHIKRQAAEDMQRTYEEAQLRLANQ